ncbi:MAG: hypothetical protein IJX62_04195, partial [Clostridia bacterium]|nr:hypothetical protein [Clostridia bacterium]
TEATSLDMVLANGKMFVFELGTSSTTLTNASYTVTIDNLAKGSYKVECYIRLVGSGSDLRYSLAAGAGLDEVSCSVTVSFTDPKLHATMGDEDRVITPDTQSATFAVTHNFETAPTAVNATVYYKAQDAYTAMGALVLPVSNGEVSIDLVALKQQMGGGTLPAGTYKIVFESNGATSECYFVILPENS